MRIGSRNGCEEVLEKQMGYWRNQLAGTPPMLEMPTDRPRPPVQSYKGGYQPLIVESGLTQKLEQLSQRHSHVVYVAFSGIQDATVSVLWADGYMYWHADSWPESQRD